MGLPNLQKYSIAINSRYPWAYNYNTETTIWENIEIRIISVNKVKSFLQSKWFNQKIYCCDVAKYFANTATS